MRKIVSFALLFTFIIGAVTPTFAQRGSERKESRSLKIPAQFEQTGAITDGSGVLVRWVMKTEKGVSAYDVYRVGEGQKVLINPTKIPGSAGRFGEKEAQGEMYQFFDLEGQPGMTYLVEGIGLDGQRFTSKEFTATVVRSVEAEAGFSSEALAKTRLDSNSTVEHRDVAISGELQDLVSLYEQEPDPVMQRVVAAQHGAKIMVKKSGFYRVTSAELQSAHFPINSDSTKWRLFMNGREQSILIGPGSQYIEFYGHGVDTPETDIRMYYLITDTVAGKRISSKALRPLPGAPTSFRYTVVAGKKERMFYSNKLFNGPDENFLGRFIDSSPVSIPINLSAVDSTVATATIKISCYGFTSNRAHIVTPTINGLELPPFTQYGTVDMSGTYTIPASNLQEGANELQLRTSALADQVLFDKVEITYQRKYIADQDKISFSTPGYKKVDLKGFTTSAVRVFDMTFDGNPVLISNATVREENGGFVAQVPTGRPMVGYAFESTAALQSPGVLENFSSTLSDITNRADMIIVTDPTPSFVNSAENWADYRRSSAGGNFNVKVVSIADVYDEFSYGTSGADSLKTFLKYAYSEWATGPKYLLLLGDATYDPRNYEGYGNFNLIPTESVTLLLEESVSDDSLVDFDDDGLTEMAIGRVAARSATEINSAYNKMRAYEANQQSFGRGTVLAHDLPIGFDFANMSQQLCQKLPTGTACTLVSSGDADARGDTIAAINLGPFIANYSGHGATGFWSSSNFFNVNDVASLTNANNPTVFNMLTCLNGYFVRTNADSLSERLVSHPGGGAASAWASTSETTPDIQLEMGLRFFDQMSTASINVHRVGDLVRDAKTVIAAGADVRLSWVLLGDPAMKMP